MPCVQGIVWHFTVQCSPSSVSTDANALPMIEQTASRLRISWSHIEHKPIHASAARLV